MKESKNNLQPDRGKPFYSYLLRKFTFLTIICSLVPLLLAGWGLTIYYTHFARSRITQSFRDQVENHKRFIEQFLLEQSSKLTLISYANSKEYLLSPGNLQSIFENINRRTRTITDIGLINDEGKHLAYIGPYDLIDKNYSGTQWFKEVMQKGIYISDMFTGFRNEPHFIIAVARPDNNEKWILRATVNTDVFRTLVENVKIGETGEVYLLNRLGFFQTSPRFSGRIMEKSNVDITGFSGTVVDIHTDSAEKNSSEYITGKSWISKPEWMLVIRQKYTEAFSEINHATDMNLIFLHISALSIIIVAIFITRYMVKIIRTRDHEAEQLNAQLLQASKLASIGELAAGVAHEINNPVAIIMTERQILLDQYEDSTINDEEFVRQFITSIDQIAVQANRCKRITHNLLRFSKRTKSIIETVDLNMFLVEIIDLMEREARTGGIKFMAALDENIPRIKSDISQLQQVFLNLITNAIDAHNGKPYGSISISTKKEQNPEGVSIAIADSGCGIQEKDIVYIFDPFYSTKPVGKGTGLGLSICHTIIQNLGGKISVQSTPGEGTEFNIFLPVDFSIQEQEADRQR
ncbi:MAG: ATP-binding protein [Desulfobacteraceae bacterium]|jgi:two-component system NtrC family sensor kinase